MQEKLKAYFDLKEQQKKVESELEKLRHELIRIFPEPIESDIGEYRLKIAIQERREYDDQAVYNRMKDDALWKLMSKVDPAKISGLIKLDVIKEEMLAGTYEIKKIPYVQVKKR
ncbi:hypothetical protein [Paenibacillus sp. J2TS4]|uniref:hypothetical protein n=1 Tax=Paenibacillus sp. J2TS4 TaxID=2807194 RepID=UPI001B06BF96|nr:hypothetical protein [Paenibacillus sp. J2TS4]GIP31178.1 hypothetical protein J2TS4_03880 [Paenibacillus sp. J2TS4]